MVGNTQDLVTDACPPNEGIFLAVDFQVPPLRAYKGVLTKSDMVMVVSDPWLQPWQSLNSVFSIEAVSR